MIINETQLMERLNSPSNFINQVEHRGYTRNQNVSAYQPEFLREVEAGLIIQGEQGKDVAKAFETTPQAVSRYNNGKGLDENGKIRMEERKGKARDKALDSLMNTLGLLDEDDGKKLKDLGAKDLSIVAGNLSKVVEKMDSKGNIGLHNTLIIYAPQQRKESDFEVITI